MGAVSSTGVGETQDLPDASNANPNEPCRSENTVLGGPSTSAPGKDGDCDTSSGDDPHGHFGEFSPNKKTTFDNLPDEVLIKILAAVSSSAEKPADVAAPAMTCRRWRSANSDREVRRRTSRQGVGIRTRHWGEGAVWFLQRLCDAGCLEACFMLGMILFYCIPGGQLDGGKLLLHSAKAGHAASLHSLGIMSFTGSGFSAQSKDFRSGLALCTKAAALGHAEAMREVGLCLLDGFGVQQNHVDGWRLLLKAQLAELGIRDNLLETGLSHQSPKRAFSDFDEGGPSTKRLRTDVFGNSARICKEEQDAAVSRLLELPAMSNQAVVKLGAETPIGVVASTVMNLVRSAKPSALPGLRPVLQQLEAPLVDVPIHPAHDFIAEWFQSQDESTVEEMVVELSGKGVATVKSATAGKCSRAGCGRREFRPLEFWRCANCWNARYCSRACQLQDWRGAHKANCHTLEAVIS